MGRSQPWPFDDDDRPSGSVRPLSQADLQIMPAHLADPSDQVLASTGMDQPVRASVGQPGGSAQATGRRLRAAEWASWIRTLPWRIAATLGVGISGGVFGSLLAQRLGLVTAPPAAAAAGWGLRFRPAQLLARANARTAPPAKTMRTGQARETHPVGDNGRPIR